MPSEQKVMTPSPGSSNLRKMKRLSGKTAREDNICIFLVYSSQNIFTYVFIFEGIFIGGYPHLLL